ncbi:MAG: hypothetical protein Q9160_007415 [Pyrenula sp. 1 TL-2023]
MDEGDSRKLLLDIDETSALVLKKKRPKLAFVLPSIPVIIIVLAFLSNIYFLQENRKLRNTPDKCRTAFSGLALDVPTEYNPHSVYSSNNATLADTAWEALDSSPIIVALTDEYAMTHGLETAPTRFPWDENKEKYPQSIQ